MKTMFRKTLTLLLALVIIGSVVPPSAAAADEQAQPETEETGNAMGYVRDDIVIDVPETYYHEPGVMLAGELPRAYDLRYYGRVTSVKNQNPHGTCWAFSVMACIESNLITNGYADGTIDLSEKHLAYYTFANAPDKLGNTAGDYVSVANANEDYLSVGGNSWLAANTLANWEGVVTEETVPYSGFDLTYPAEDAYQNDVYHLDSTYMVPIESRDYIKQLIMDKGAAEVGIHYSNSYMNSQTGGYCTKLVSGTNHSVTLVGWDDDFSKDNFLASYTPRANGAWLVKNSWGAEWPYGIDGYFWLSYEDSSLNSEGNEATFFEATPVGDDYNIYQYDGSAVNAWVELNSGSSAANVYTAADDELLKEVAFYTLQPNISYSVQVYTGVTSSPNGGAAALTNAVTGVVPAAGYHTVSLPQPVLLRKGEKFALAITLTTSNGTKVKFATDSTSRGGGVFNFNTACGLGQGYYKMVGRSWVDLVTQLNSNFRIKGVTTRLVLPGDVNGDGEVTLMDATVLLRWLTGCAGATINEECADVNSDGKVTMLDSTILRRYLAGWSGVELG